MRGMAAAGDGAATFAPDGVMGNRPKRASVVPSDGRGGRMEAIKAPFFIPPARRSAAQEVAKDACEQQGLFQVHGATLAPHSTPSIRACCMVCHDRQRRRHAVARTGLKRWQAKLGIGGGER